MHLVRFSGPGTARARVGIEEHGVITPLAVESLGVLLAAGADTVRSTVDEATRLSSSTGFPASTVRLLAPLDGVMEVWAAGVTYRRSQEARMQENERSATVYERVYDAARPELFFKSAAWRVCGDTEPIAVRADSQINVPEPELALVLDATGRTVGYTICDDVSSRSIEGENPLYLPQAKTYLGSCAVGPAIRPAWEVPDPYDLDIEMHILRSGQFAWEGRANTGELHRKFEDLVEHLFRADAFPEGVVLSTGTCIVPDLPFTLQPNDIVRITIDQVGVLTNTVVQGLDAMRWLRPDAIDREASPSLSGLGGRF